jgi:hypothetical protein
MMAIATDKLEPQRTARSGERRPVGRPTRRIGLTIFFVSVAVNAGLGIYAVLAPGFGETQAKILGTSLCVTATVLLGLACEPAWERRRLGPVPVAGAMLGAMGFALAIVLIWAQPESETWAKVMTTALTASFAGVAASLLALTRLAPRHQWVFTATLALLAVAAGMFSAVPWVGEPGEWYVRALGVVMIVLAAFVVTVPVLHWIDRGALAVAEAAAVAYCPFCGHPLSGDEGDELACSRCRQEFTVRPVGRRLRGQSLDRT